MKPDHQPKLNGMLAALVVLAITAVFIPTATATAPKPACSFDTWQSYSDSGQSSADKCLSVNISICHFDSWEAYGQADLAQYQYANDKKSANPTVPDMNTKSSIVDLCGVISTPLGSGDAKCDDVYGSKTADWVFYHTLGPDPSSGHYTATGSWTEDWEPSNSNCELRAKTCYMLVEGGAKGLFRREFAKIGPYGSANDVYGQYTFVAAAFALTSPSASCSQYGLSGGGYILPLALYVSGSTV